jgi:tetratricopeptide (TPR) repeat protein
LNSSCATDAPRLAAGSFTFCSAEAHFYLASIYYDISDFDRSEKIFLKAIENFQRIQCLPSLVRLCKLNILLTRLCKSQNKPELHRVLSKAKKNKLKVYEGWTCRTVSEIFAHSNVGNFEEAEDWIKKAIESDSQNGTMWQLGMDFALYADLFKRKGDKSKAKEKLARGIDILKECGADGWVEKYEKELATLP